MEIEASLTEYRERKAKLEEALQRTNAQREAIVAQLNATVGAIQALERIQAKAPGEE